jgi:hypothetical protein
VANDLNLDTLRNIAMWDVTIHKCLTLYDIGQLTLEEAATTAACVLAENNRRLSRLLMEAIKKGYTPNE